MTHATGVLVRIADRVRGGSLLILLLAGCCFSQTITVSPKNGPPTSHLTVGGSGFPTNSVLDVYFDLTDLALAVTDSTGAFSKVSIQAPSSALPGIHYITAVARANQAAAQTSFNVRTDWPQFGFASNNQRQNPYENVLNANNVSGLDLSWTFVNGISILSSPAISGGSIYFGSEDGNLYALNATTGKKIWSYTTIEPGALVSGRFSRECLFRLLRRQCLCPELQDRSSTLELLDGYTSAVFTDRQ